MRFVRLTMLWLLCCSACNADVYWSHFPGVGAVQLTNLSAQQHSILATHLALSAEGTALWLDNLPEQLANFSCELTELQSQFLPVTSDEPFQLVSYAGLLKWWSEKNDKSSIWWLPWQLLPELGHINSVVKTGTMAMHQPQVVAQNTAQSSTVQLVSGSLATVPLYYSLDLSSVFQPQLLWFIEPTQPGFAELAGSMAKPLLLPLGDEQKLSVILPNTAPAPAQVLLYMADAQTGEFRAKLVAEQNVAAVSGAVTVFDQSMDLTPDTLVFATKNGQVWQAGFEQNQFFNLQQLTDFTGKEIQDIHFVRMIYAATPTGGTGSDFHSRRSQWLLLLQGVYDQSSLLMVVKLQVGSVVVWSDLVDRTLPKAPLQSLLTSERWQDIQQKQGWYSLLNGYSAQPPLVVAGVIYLTQNQTETSSICQLSSSSSDLLALHLHNAAPMYKSSELQLEKPVGALAVSSTSDGRFVLVDQHSQEVLLESLVEITPACSSCSQTLRQDSFPRWHLLGTYHNEEGAYE